MGGSIINATDKLKYLGVIIDDNITWIPHITYVKNKVSRGIGIMFKARNYLKRNALVNLYHSFIYPYLIYCIEAWGNATNCYPMQLYLIQKKVIRMIAFANYNTPSIDIFKNMNILPLDKLVIDRIGIIVYKYANDLLPPALNYLYTSNSDVHNYTTRQRYLLHVNKSNINTFSNSFGNTSAHIWNVVQSKIEVKISLSKFRISLKLYLQEHSLQFKYTKSEILYYVSCTFCLPKRINIEVNILISYPLVVYHIVCHYHFIHSTACFLKIKDASIVN